MGAKQQRRLTEEERAQIVEMRLSGTTYREIGEVLGIGESLVQYHCRQAGLAREHDSTTGALVPVNDPLQVGFAWSVPEWMENAVCAQTDPESFFPEKGGSTYEAKKVCASCLVQAECLDYALDHDERFGIWGGLSERERRRIKKHLNNPLNQQESA